ncbi:hypothetical protein BKA67DRAFT_534105 [Truncatella angustata]|uniref:Uncharacterized protein n=1 Tax=Truncatella angustata TaxID=152316 RepID=A0A9P8UM50_9PEZI|nr:uncharacterized protein BKA67DRAFT_534105 [Truncatella angustata]KAH6655169.1 hypothetical protein BKA67DRAFT_534105 [Truncatella angustata]KAH8204716.1 hypothetical protein TruAng_001050 [Truncatella angustata]
MPRVKLMVRRQHGSSSTVLSRPALIGIALGGSVILFLALSHLFIVLGRRRDRKRLTLLQTAARSELSILYETPLFSHELVVPPKNGRLRKKSLGISTQNLVVLDGEVRIMNKEDIGTTSQTVLPPVLPPVFSRKQSYDLNMFLPNRTEDGGSTTPTKIQDCEMLTGEIHGPSKQGSAEASRMRKKSLWIDEDALHGPRVCPASHSDKSKNGRLSWITGWSLGNKLGLSQHFSDSSVFKSPTIPQMEHEGSGYCGRGRLRERTSMKHKEDETVATPSRTVLQGNPLGKGQYGPSRTMTTSASTAAPTARVPEAPSETINNPRLRENVAHEAAQELAGSARVPIPQRPQAPKHSATDTELTEILRMTTERLRDSERSSRRRLIFIQAKNGGFIPLSTEPATANNRPSPVKSQKSAPAVMYTELEAIDAILDEGLPGSHVSRHSRQVSQMSWISEPDSLVTPRRVSQPEHTTPLSSPSRNIQTTEPRSQEDSLQPIHPLRPASVASSHSSALSTLYSEDEDHGGESSTQLTYAGLACLPTASKSTTTARPITPGVPFEEGKVPYLGPFDVRRTTLGQLSIPRSLPEVPTVENAKLVKAWLPQETSLQFNIYTLDVPCEDDPFIAVTPPSQDPVRLSQVFTSIPLSMNYAGDDPRSKDDIVNGPFPVVRSTKLNDSPTPSPKSHRHVPPPQALRPMMSSPTLGNSPRRPSPVLSEGGLSSVYEHYAFSSGASATLDHSTATLSAIRMDDSLPPPSTGDTLGPERPKSNRTRPGALGSAVVGAAQSRKRAESPRAAEPALFRDHHRRGEDAGGEDARELADDDNDDDIVPPLRNPARPTSKVVNTIAELRRMNSAVSAISSVSGCGSVAAERSPTLLAARGGGFSPGLKNGGTRNYLAMGGPGSASGTRKSGGSSSLVTGDREMGTSALTRTGTRSRRGTVVDGGNRRGGELDGKLRELTPKGILREGSGGNVVPAANGRDGNDKGDKP